MKLEHFLTPSDQISHSVVSDSLRPHGLQPATLFCPWGFSRQEYWGDLPNPRIEPRSPTLLADSLPSEAPRGRDIHVYSPYIPLSSSRKPRISRYSSHTASTLQKPEFRVNVVQLEQPNNAKSSKKRLQRMTVRYNVGFLAAQKFIVHILGRKKILRDFKFRGLSLQCGEFAMLKWKIGKCMMIAYGAGIRKNQGIHSHAEVLRP